VDKLIGTQQSEIVATPEHAADAPALAALCLAAGRPARVGRQRRPRPGTRGLAPELNRQAMAGGITLRALAVEPGLARAGLLCDHEGPRRPDVRRVSRASGSRLRRRAMLLWDSAAAFFAVLATVFTIERATKTFTFPERAVTASG